MDSLKYRGIYIINVYSSDRKKVSKQSIPRNYLDIAIYLSKPCEVKHYTCNGVTQTVVITRYIGVVHTERDQYY